MMTTTAPLTLQAEPRHETGKRARFLRRQGVTPANLYGRGVESLALQIPTGELQRILASGGRNALLALSVNGSTRRVLLRGLQRHPITRAILHADFHQVEMDRPIEAAVPLRLVGEAPAARLPDVVITQVLHALEIQCLPGNIPAAIEVDLSPLTGLDTAILVRDLPIPPGVTVLTDPEQPVMRAARARIAEEAKPTEEAPAEEGAAEPEAEAKEEG